MVSSPRRTRLRIFTIALGVLLSAFFALTAFTESARALTSTENYRESLRSSSSKYPSGAQDVIIGAYIDNIQSINYETSSFTADFFIWMRWSNRNLQPDLHFEIMNSSDSWSTTIAPLEVGPIEQPDGTLYHSFHYQGAFNFKPNLQAFPFGGQLLPIQIEGTLNGKEALNFIPDSTPIVIDPGFTLPGYKIGNPSLTTTMYAYATDFGEVGVEPVQEYSRAIISLPISNPVWSNIVKYFLPLFLVVITASFVFLIPARLGDAKIALGITALLTLVAMEGSRATGLPSVDYLMLIDVLYILSYIFIVLSIVQTVVMSWNERQVSLPAGVNAVRRFTAIYLIIYFVAVGLTTYLFLL